MENKFHRIRIDMKLLLIFFTLLMSCERGANSPDRNKETLKRLAMSSPVLSKSKSMEVGIRFMRAILFASPEKLAAGETALTKPQF